MKLFRLLLSATLAMGVLTALMVTLSLGHPADVKAEEQPNAPAAPAAPLTLPPPYLSDDDVADAPYDNPPPPKVDGYLHPGEYAGAGKVTFTGFGGDVEAFFKQDSANLYVAVELPDKVTPGPIIELLVDTNNDGGSAPQPDDFAFTVYRTGAPAVEWRGNGSTWVWTTTITWTYGATDTLSGWSAEYSIPFAKLGITTDVSKVLGLALHNGKGFPPDYFWPAGANNQDIDAWGSLVSSSDWGTTYWKPGPWEDYAPSGMPDFDQTQNPAWAIPGPMGPVSTHCGPVAMANSLWWFDSKFETPDHPPRPYSDTYRLVTSYDPAGAWDDHDPQNVVPLVDDLANKYFNTNDIQGFGAWAGTRVTDMHAGTLNYLRNHGLWDDYIVTLVISPSFEWVAEEVMYSEDVILLLGFYEWVDPPGYWARVGGHYVDVAGVDAAARLIAFSDPYLDATENGIGIIPPGRVLSGTILPHQPIPGHTRDTHNDAGNISHDVYMVVDTNSPGGTWGPEGYPLAFEPVPFLGANPHPDIDMLPWSGGPTQVEVEFALAVSPFDWKSSGEWLSEGEDEVQGTWQPWQDYAVNGMPDIDQKQDNWGPPPGPLPWTFCGPVAAANSLWWFDSKFEPQPLGPPPPPPLQPPIPSNDNYPLVQSYDPAGAWDDHDPLNADNPATPWPGPGMWPPPIPPGAGEFVEDLATYFQTDMMGSGTVITNMYLGIDAYLWNHQVAPSDVPGLTMRQSYVITMVKSPDFWWAAEEVEVSEDVILLLGFWEEQPPGSGNYSRLGGHYVTLPGVDKQGGLVAFSDPYYDGAEYAWPYAYPGGWPTVMGRVADGWLTSHPPYHQHASNVHNDVGNVSHDIYYVTATDSPGGVWGPEGYVEGWDGTFERQNGGGEEYNGGPIQAEVDWALAVSPIADLYVAKRVTPMTVTPGDWVTFNVFFINTGSLPAENVVISDVLPAGLTNITYTYDLNYPGTLVAHDTYTWAAGALAWMEGGRITITAQVDPRLSWPDRTTITNTAEITTNSQEQYQIPPMANSTSVSFTVQTADVSIAKTMGPLATVLRPGDWITFTLDYANAGPATAASVLITDLIPVPPLTTTGASTSTSNNYGGLLTPVGGSTFAWRAGDLTAGSRGRITISAQIDPNLATGGRYTNTAEIATLTPDHDSSNDESKLGFDVCVPPAGAFFTYTPPVPVVNHPVTFTGSVTKGAPVAYRWDFSDPTGLAPPSGNPVSYTYGSAGPYTVWMTASNTCDYDVYSETISVCEPVANLSIQYAPPDPEVNQTILFTATSTGSGPITYDWVASDGWSDTGPTVTHAFATGGDFTVYLTATNGCGQVYTSTVVFVRTYGVNLAPPAAQRTDAPGALVVHTMTVHNTGNVADTYDITATVSNEPWTTTVPLAVGPVTGGGSQQFTVSVQIPSGGVSDGDWSRATVTATSQHDPSKSDTSVLTTTATTQPITRGVALAPPADAKSGNVGADVIYQLTVTNTGSVADTISLGASGYNWPTAVRPGSVSLGSGKGGQVVVTVTVPSTATHGDLDVATIVAQGTGASDSSVLTTTAVVPPSYGVYLIPAAAQEAGYNGSTVVFTFTVQNAGNVPDSFTLSTAGDDWPTALSTSGVGPLNPNITATLQVSVTIPGSAAGSTFDRASITAQSVASPTVSETSVFTTTVLDDYVVHLEPPSASLTGNPSKTVTYTLYAYNDGNVTDTYGLAHTLATWSTSLSTSTVGPIAPRGNESFQVYVTIPGSAISGTEDVVTVTATSQSAVGVVEDDSILTTIATTQTITRGVAISPHAVTGVGNPGETITYTLRVTNTGNVPDIIGLDHEGPIAWTVTYSRTLSLGSGIGTDVNIYVEIPPGTLGGISSTITITATSQGDPTKSDTATLTTHVGERHIYLPLVMRDYALP
jgi:uncharacterized repeat protein (TIGR01451 family)